MSTNEQQEQTNPNRPIMSFQGSGGIHLAVWKNKTESNVDTYSVKIERRYKDDKDGEFKSTSYLGASDLLRAANLLEQADAWIEADKQKSRLTSQSSAAR